MGQSPQILLLSGSGQRPSTSRHPRRSTGPLCWSTVSVTPSVAGRDTNTLRIHTAIIVNAQRKHSAMQGLGVEGVTCASAHSLPYVACHSFSSTNSGSALALAKVFEHTSPHWLQSPQSLDSPHPALAVPRLRRVRGRAGGVREDIQLLLLLGLLLLGVADGLERGPQLLSLEELLLILHVKQDGVPWPRAVAQHRPQGRDGVAVLVKPNVAVALQ